MEGRLGRASSRYGPTTTVFNGPVRKWKKTWVHVARSSPSTVAAQSNGQNSLLLRRWTPTGDEPPPRKFRYTPIAVIEEQRKVSEQSTEEYIKPEKSDQSPVKSDHKNLKAIDDPKIETMVKEKKSSDIDLGIDLHDLEHEENDGIATGENSNEV